MPTIPGRPWRRVGAATAFEGAGTARPSVTSVAVITLDAVTKRYGADSVAVDELRLTVADGEGCVLVGPSGCGKATTLRMINRLTEPSSGRILIDDTDVLKMDPVQLR